MRDIAHGILHGLVVAAILLTAAAWAPAQTPAPYAITNSDPLVIELEAGATSGTFAFLENVTPHSFGRTSGTRAGFDFHCTSDGGQGYTGLVWWNGLPGGGTYRAAIELPAGRLSAPEDYSGMPWDWSRVEVFDGPIGSAAPCAIKVDVTLEDGHALRDTSRAFVGTSGAPGPELVTEDYLQRQISEKMADQLARPFSFMWTRSHWPSVQFRIANDWPNRTWGYQFRNWRAFGRPGNDANWPNEHRVIFYAHLPAPIYEGGDVKTGSCRTLPNSGVKQTGDYQIIDNEMGDEDVDRTLETTVSDTLDESITLNESVEFSNSTTVEAGADIGGVSASASNTFSVTLGIDKSKTDDHSVTMSRTVTTAWAIPAGTKSVAVFSADRTVIDCHVDIGASMNWPGIKLSLGNGFQPLTGRNYWQEGPVWYGNNPFSASLADVTDRHGDLTFPGGGGVEDVWRLLKGYDVRGGNNLRFEHWPASISAAIETLADASYRFLSFNGTRRSVSNDSASVTFIDVTGVSDEDIDRIYGR